MREHRIHLVPRHEAFAARRCAGCESPFHSDEEGQDHADRRVVVGCSQADGNAVSAGRYCKNVLNRPLTARKVHRWRYAKYPLKRAREVWLIMEAAFHGNLRKRHLPGLHKTGGSLKAKPQHELVRGDAQH